MVGKGVHGPGDGLGTGFSPTSSMNSGAAGPLEETALVLAPEKLPGL